MSIEEEASPMLVEMTPRTKADESEVLNEKAKTSNEGEVYNDDDDDIETGSVAGSEDSLALEYAVGTGVPHSWDVSNESEDSCEDQVNILGRRVQRFVCGIFGARRLGHMGVLYYRRLDTKEYRGPFCFKRKKNAHQTKNGSRQVQPRRNQSRTDPNSDEPQTKLICMMGPFWPFSLLVTYPLILLVSIAVAAAFLPGRSWPVIICWSISVLSLLIALSCTACSNPGILRRRTTAPNASWRWNDQARTFRPPGAVYDEDLGLIVEEFDHVCPWTGTGIGANNLAAFHAFITILCICIIIDVLLLLQILP